MPARSGAAGAPTAPPVPPRRGPARDVDGLIRDLQRINLSQCMDQLTADIQQLSSMERQLSSAWQGLYVRCPGPEPDDLTAEPADKKSSSGYSTESGSPPGSRNTSGDTIDAHAVDGYRVEGRTTDRHGTDGRSMDGLAASGYRTERNLLNGHRSSGHTVNGSAANTHAVNGNAVNRHVVTGSAVNAHAVNSYGVNSHALNGNAVNSHTMNSQAVNGHAVNSHAVNSHAVNNHAVNGHPDCNDGDGVYGRGRTTVDSFKPRAGSPGWGGRRAEGGYGLTASALVRDTERASGAGQRSVAVNGAQRGAGAVVNGFSHRNGLANGLSNGLGNGFNNGLSDGPGSGFSNGFGNRVVNGLSAGVVDVSTASDGFSFSSTAGSERCHGGPGGLRSGERVESEQPWRPLVGLESPIVARRCGGGLLQSSVAHSSQPRPVTPLVSRAPFCPPAASTPTLSPKLPRSPKTLRFAASHELIPPESPRGRRRVASGAPPRPGILRSRASSVERPSPALSRPAAPGWRAADSSGSSPSPGREGADSAERFSRVVSALTKLEAELSASGAGRGGSVRLPSARATACGTAQFVRQPPRRQLSFTALPPPPRHPPLLTGSATDSDDSDSDCGSDSRWLVDTSAAARRQSEMPSEGDFVLSRGARLPPPYAGPPPRRRRPQLSWLLSCGSKRRPPSPPSAYLPPPPSEPSASPAAGAAYGCNLCKARFSEHTQLVSHVHERHVRVQMRPKYSCGLCPARFYASKFLARHCAYHHNSMGDARTPQCLKAEGRT